MLIAITGATGFIGKEILKKHLANGDQVRILSRKDIQDVENLGPEFKIVKIFKGDLLEDSVCLNEFVRGIEILYHCAAEINNKKKMMEINVQGTKNLLKLIDHQKVVWVQLSSVGAYGPQKNGLITEDFSCLPQNTYEKSKTIADELILKSSAETGLRYSILRPSNVISENMKNRSIFTIINLINKRCFFYIGKIGASANYVHVENVAEALFLCGTNKNSIGKTFILSDWLTIEDFVGTIAKELNVSIPRLRVPKRLIQILCLITYIIPRNPLTLSRVNALSNFSAYSNDYIINELNYSHKISLKKAITKMTLSWMNSRN
jgi:nucleoside-diphosphate-sugar epimerase